MKYIIRLEEWAMFGWSIYLFNQLHFAWWWFPALILTPDIGAVGYLFGNRAGAITYNTLHHKGLAIAIYLLGIWLAQEWMQLGGIIMFGHASIDRATGYGLKYFEGFGFTHLGLIGKSAREARLSGNR